MNEHVSPAANASVARPIVSRRAKYVAPAGVDAHGGHKPH